MPRTIRVRSGDLRHRVGIAKRDQAEDSFGEIVGDGKAPSVLFTRWAKVEPRDGFEPSEAKQIAPEVTHKVEMWYDPGITPDKLVIHKGREFEIVSVLNRDERDVKMVLACRESNPTQPVENVT